MMDENKMNILPDDTMEETEDRSASGDITEENTSAGAHYAEHYADDAEEGPDGHTAEHYAEGTSEDDEEEYEKDELDDDDEYVEEDEEEDDYDAEAERERLREQRRRRKRKKKTHGRLVFGLIMTTVIISVSILCAATIISLGKEILGLGRSDTELAVDIPENSSTEDIAGILLDEGVIGNSDIFRLVSKIRGADGMYVAGSHKLSMNMTYSDIMDELMSAAINDREFIDVTFPEGIRLIDAANKLEEAGVCDAKEFIYAFNSSVFGFDFEKEVKTSSLKFYKMEGYFFPDTYRFYLDEDPKTVAKKICKNFEYKITRDYYGRMEDMGMTLEEVLTLASIVQAEASGTRDMKIVSSVFHNRLNDPDTFPLLQSDPTSKYVREVIKPNIEVKSQKMFDAYDTYTGPGLPPGPICNPGIEAIEAVLYPRETNYYYFCSDLETGEFFYARTLDEHESNLVAAHLV